MQIKIYKRVNVSLHSYQAHLVFWQIGTEPSDNQYLVADIGLAAVPILLIGNTAPHDNLTKGETTDIK